jgi:hypothetical protein
VVVVQVVRGVELLVAAVDGVPLRKMCHDD